MFLIIITVLLYGSTSIKWKWKFYNRSETQIQNYQKNQKQIEDLNLKEIHKEQINLRKHINKICHRNNFKHLAIPNGSFIIDQKHNFAYCLHAKV